MKDLYYVLHYRKKVITVIIRFSIFVRRERIKIGYFETIQINRHTQKIRKEKEQKKKENKIIIKIQKIRIARIFCLDNLHLFAKTSEKLQQ